MATYFSHALRGIWPRLIILLCMSLLLTSCENYDVILENVSQTEANTALVLLREHHIDAKKEGLANRKDISYHIKVKKAQSEQALRLLVHNRIPNIPRAGLKEIYPPGSSGIIPTKTDEIARMNMALQGEIEALLKVVPNIADARVVLSADTSTDFAKKEQKRSASVAIIYYANDDDEQPPLLHHEVKSLVAASLTGLLPEDVNVVQKAIKPIVDDTKQFAMGAVDQKKNRTSQWLIIVTIFALLLAGYGLVRLFLERRVAA